MVVEFKKLRNGYDENPVVGAVSASKVLVAEYPHAGVCVKVAKGISNPRVSRM